jgi:transcriptional antiterminator RfaH
VTSELRGREDERGFVRLDTRPRFALGDKFRVVDRVFEACLGLFGGMGDRERVAILLDLSSRKVALRSARGCRRGGVSR